MGDWGKGTGGTLSAIPVWGEGVLMKKKGHGGVFRMKAEGKGGTVN